MADITIDQISTQTFYQIPQIFLPSVEKIYGADGKVKEKIKATSLYARELSNDAKLAYGAFYNRCLLSIRSYHQGIHDYVDENGSVFMVYTVEDLMDVLDKGKMTVHKIKKELQKVGLLREVSQGANRPNRLYLQNVNANLQEFEHYKANIITSGRDKGKVVYDHVKTVNLNGEILFELPASSLNIPTEENGSPKNGHPKNPVISTKNGSPKNGRPHFDTQGVHIMDGSKIDLSNTELLDNSSRKSEEISDKIPHSPKAQFSLTRSKSQKYIQPKYYSLLQSIADCYNGKFCQIDLFTGQSQNFTLTHKQKMMIGQYLDDGWVTSQEVLDLIDRIPFDCQSPLAYLLKGLENLKEERRIEAKNIAHLNAERYYRGDNV